MQDRPEPGRRGLRLALPYILPYAAFALLTWAAGALPQWQALLYVIKVLVVAALLWRYRGEYRELVFRLTPAAIPAALVGIAVIVVWIGLDPYYPQSTDEWSAVWSEGFQRFAHEEKAARGFNPHDAGALIPPAVALAFRLIGAVLLVPLFEELFWRSWLIRWLISDNFRTVPMGAFTWMSFGVTVVLFGVTHHEWLAGILCGAAFNGLLYWKRDLFLCVIAHAMANAALAAWVLTQGAWRFW